MVGTLDGWMDDWLGLWMASWQTSWHEQMDGRIANWVDGQRSECLYVMHYCMSDWMDDHIFVCLTGRIAGLKGIVLGGWLAG